jgi:preprotein translocase subunit SecD
VSYTYLQFGFGGAAVLLAVAAYAVKSKRGALGWAAASALAAGLAAYNQVFWVTAVFGMMVPWALFSATSYLDSAWRTKVGFCIYLSCAAALCIYPTYIDERFDRPDQDPSFTPEQQAEIDARSKAGEFGFGRFVRANIPFRLVRGLDLKGGFRVEYVVDVQQAIKDRRDRAFDTVRTELARSFKIIGDDQLPNVENLEKLAERVVVTKPREDVGKIVITFKDEADVAVVNDDFKKAFTGEFGIVQGGGEKKKIVTFQMKKDAQDEYRKRAVDEAKQTVLRRVDTLGLKEAAVSPRGDSIVIEMPGTDDRSFKEIVDIVSQTARLEFKLPDDDADFFGAMAQQADAGQCESCTAEGIVFGRENAPGYQGIKSYAVLRKRPGESMKAARERFKLWVENNLEVPDTHQVVYGKELRMNEDTGEIEEEGWRSYYLFSKAEVTGDQIHRRAGAPDQSDRGLGGWHVNLEFTPAAETRFEEITGKNVKRRFAIVLDGPSRARPSSSRKISGGGAQHHDGAGSLDDQLATPKKLELVLRSGALPAPISPRTSSSSGPAWVRTPSPRASRAAPRVPCLVLVFMVVYYNRAGLIANVAVIFNLLLQMSRSSRCSAPSLTLPGIAGLVLTIGIAVDANVLINERIRDELRARQEPAQAVDIGYDKAFSAILDGHVTTLISGLILAQYGTGPIKGFAVTLIVGIARQPLHRRRVHPPHVRLGRALAAKSRTSTSADEKAPWYSSSRASSTSWGSAGISGPPLRCSSCRQHHHVLRARPEAGAPTSRAAPRWRWRSSSRRARGRARGHRGHQDRSGRPGFRGPRGRRRARPGEPLSHPRPRGFERQRGRQARHLAAALLR